MSIIIPSMPTVPAPGFCSKTSTIRCAWAISSALGVKARLIGSDWAGWIATLPKKPGTTCLTGFFFQPLNITEIGKDRVDRHDLRRPAGRQAQCPGQQVWTVITAIGQPIVAGAKRRREVFRTPGHAVQPISRTDETVERE